jgi:predicted phosphodiesterase
LRVFAISDVHTDFPENLQLLAGLSTHTYRNDALILAGDVSHDTAVLRTTLGLLLERFSQVFFVPGNHELWVRKGEYPHSLQKFEDILRMCESLGVRTSPLCLGQGEDRVCIVPLFSWYTKPEEGTDSLFRERAPDRDIALWADDYLIKWPAGFRPAQFFYDLNERHVGARYEAGRISFSHFLPRAELMFPSAGESPPLQPDPRVRSFNFSRVAGSTLIEKQIRALDSRVHVYGHQHRNRSRFYEGTWYVSNCLGYREERVRRSLLNPPTIVQEVWPLGKAPDPAGG